MISVLILTKNEESDLPGCLKSVEWSDDVHVFDSFSEDKTIAIAREAGCQISQRAFDGYASQRNAALRTNNFKYPWLLILDADERVPPQLASEMRDAVLSAPGEVSAFRLRRKDFLWDKWLKYSQISPYYIRLVRHELTEYEREINEVLKVSGAIESLNNPFNHYPFSKGMAHWIDKHNRYSSMEAERWHLERREGVKFSLREAFWGRDFSSRRYHQKGLFYKLPARPLIKLFYMLLFRKGILDGSAGIVYASLQVIYEYFIIIKQKEISNRR